MKSLTVIWRLVVKDVVTELRSKENLTAMIVFALLVLVIFNFAFQPGRKVMEEVAPGILWVAFSFAGILGLNRGFETEKENSCLQGLLLAPVDRSLIFLGKMAGNALFMFLMEILILPPFFIFFNYSFGISIFYLLLIMILATVGFTSVGTLFSSISVSTGQREVILPILLFPVVVPVLIAAVKTTAAVLGGKGLTGEGQWLTLMAGFAVIFTAVSILVFEHVVEE